MGAFGEVWAAVDTELDRKVALKLPRKDLLTTEEAERFLQEARSAARLRHPHVVSVHEVGKYEGQLYIVSDLVEGVNLADWLSAGRPKLEEAVDLVQKIAEALQHAHDHGVVHRDLKPSNIMIDRSNQPFIMDFGIAKRAADEVTMTIEGRILGTPAYMSPEQAKGESHLADARSDVYSLGVILFELLTGELPFRGTVPMVLHQKNCEDAPAPRRLNNRIPHDLDTICVKCLEKEPRRRYQSASSVAEELSRYRKGLPVVARPIGRIARGLRWCRRNPFPVGSAFLITSTLLVSLAFALANAEHRRNLLYISEMNVASQAWEDNNVALVKTYLEKQTPSIWQRDLRGFEWYWLQRQISAGEEVQYLELEAVPKTLAYNAKSNRVATALSDGKVLTFKFTPDERPITTEAVGWEQWNMWARYLQDGRLAYPRMVKGNTNQFELVTALDREPPIRMRLDDRPLLEVSSSPSGQQIAIGLGEKGVWYGSMTPSSYIQICDKEGNSKLEEPFDGALRSLVWSPNESFLIACGGSGIRGWNCADWTSIASLESNTKNQRINCTLFSKDGDLLLAGREDGWLLVYETRNWSQVAAFAAHRDGIRSLAFSRDGHLITGSRDNSIRIWHPEAMKESTLSWKELAVLKGHSSIINAVVCIEDDNGREWIVSASKDYYLRFWEMSKYTSSDVIDLKSGINFIATSKAGEGIAIGGSRVNTSPGDYPESDGTLSWMSIETGQEIEGLAELAKGERQIDTQSPHCIGIQSGKEIRIHQLDLGREFHLHNQQSDKQDIPTTFAVAPNYETAIVGYQNGKVECWDLSTKEIRWFRNREKRILALAYDARGLRVATGCGDFETSIHVYDVTKGEQLGHDLKGHKDSILSLSFSPIDSDLLVSGSWDNQIRVWNLRTEEHRDPLTEHTASVHQLLFSADGKTLVSAGGDRTIRIWDTKYWQQKAVLRGHNSAVYCLAWAKNENVLLSGGLDKSLRFWRTSRTR